MLLDGQRTKWLPVKTGVPQDSILRPFFSLFTLIALSGSLLWTVKLFADDISLIFVVNDSNISVNELIKSAKNICVGLLVENIFQSWFKTYSGSDIFQETKQISSKNLFNNAPVACANWQKHLGFLNESLNFSYHIKEKCPKQWREQVSLRNLGKHFPGILL